MIENIKKGFGFGIGFSLGVSILRVISKHYLNEEKDEKSSENTTGSEES